MKSPGKPARFTKKHQVTSTSNGWSFGYDSNGNVTNNRGATITWTSYNLPSSIVNSSLSSTFSYTPMRQYWKQAAQFSAGSSTTVYVGGILEKVSSGGIDEYRHMVRVGGSTIIISRATSGSNNTWFVSGDHLESNSVVTTSGGLVQVPLNFGAFGQRRGSNWQGTPSSGDWANIAGTTSRGFTDHTMLDNLQLVHMNGRIQDPWLGRFLSADPTIPNPEGTQHFNRYSYVVNNPLTLSDPSGFAARGFNVPERVDGDDGGLWSTAQELASGRGAMAGQWMWGGSDSPRMGSFSGAGWFQLTRMQGFRGAYGAFSAGSVMDPPRLAGRSPGGSSDPGGSRPTRPGIGFEDPDTGETIIPIVWGTASSDSAISLIPRDQAPTDPLFVLGVHTNLVTHAPRDGHVWFTVRDPKTREIIFSVGLWQNDHVTNTIGADPNQRVVGDIWMNLETDSKIVGPSKYISSTYFAMTAGQYAQFYSFMKTPAQWNFDNRMICSSWVSQGLVLTLGPRYEIYPGLFTNWADPVDARRQINNWNKEPMPGSVPRSPY